MKRSDSRPSSSQNTDTASIPNTDSLLGEIVPDSFETDSISRAPSSTSLSPSANFVPPFVSPSYSNPSLPISRSFSQKQKGVLDQGSIADSRYSMDSMAPFKPEFTTTDNEPSTPAPTAQPNVRITAPGPRYNYTLPDPPKAQPPAQTKTPAPAPAPPPAPAFDADQYNRSEIRTLTDDLKKLKGDITRKINDFLKQTNSLRDTNNRSISNITLDPERKSLINDPQFELNNVKYDIPRFDWGYRAKETEDAQKVPRFIEETKERWKKNINPNIKYKDLGHTPTNRDPAISSPNTKIALEEEIDKFFAKKDIKSDIERFSSLSLQLSNKHIEHNNSRVPVTPESRSGGNENKAEEERAQSPAPPQNKSWFSNPITSTYTSLSNAFSSLFQSKTETQEKKPAGNYAKPYSVPSTLDTWEQQREKAKKSQDAYVKKGLEKVIETRQAEADTTAEKASAYQERRLAEQQKQLQELNQKERDQIEAEKRAEENRKKSEKSAEEVKKYQTIQRHLDPIIKSTEKYENRLLALNKFKNDFINRQPSHQSSEKDLDNFVGQSNKEERKRIFIEVVRNSPIDRNLVSKFLQHEPYLDGISYTTHQKNQSAPTPQLPPVFDFEASQARAAQAQRRAIIDEGNPNKITALQQKQNAELQQRKDLEAQKLRDEVAKKITKDEASKSQARAIEETQARAQKAQQEQQYNERLIKTHEQNVKRLKDVDEERKAMQERAEQGRNTAPKEQEIINEALRKASMPMSMPVSQTQPAPQKSSSWTNPSELFSTAQVPRPQNPQAQATQAPKDALMSIFSPITSLFGGKQNSSSPAPAPAQVQAQVQPRAEEPSAGLAPPARRPQQPQQPQQIFINGAIHDRGDLKGNNPKPIGTCILTNGTTRTILLEEGVYYCTKPGKIQGAGVGNRTIEELPITNARDISSLNLESGKIHGIKSNNGKLYIVAKNGRDLFLHEPTTTLHQNQQTKQTKLSSLDQVHRAIQQKEVETIQQKEAEAKGPHMHSTLRPDQLARFTRPRKTSPQEAEDQRKALQRAMGPNSKGNFIGGSRY